MDPNKDPKTEETAEAKAKREREEAARRDRQNPPADTTSQKRSGQ